MRVNGFIVGGVVAALAFSEVGCAKRSVLPARSLGEAPQNWFLPTVGGRMIRRVALLPVYHNRYPAECLQDLDSAFNSELVKKTVFEVVSVSRPEMEAMIGLREVSSVGRVPGDLIAKLKERYGVDGVMFTDVTHFSPYRPVAIGVRSKLVDTEQGRIHWASDVLFDSSNSEVVAAAREYQRTLGRNNYPVEGDLGAILVSPRLFSQFAAHANYVSLKR
jgi:hypothetical protein